MLLTVGFINLLSHVSTLVMGGGDLALYLNKLQPVEVIRHWIGESNTSTFQQQQFQHQLKMLLSGGGEGGGITSPIASHGSGGASKEDQLPRGSRQSMPDSAEQSSVPHLSKTPSKRIRSSFDETSVEASQGFNKKARLSHNSGQRPSEEQEETSLQSGKLNISQNSPVRSGDFQGTYDEEQVSSKQASQEVQKTKSFDDLLTQAIQAVSPQTSSPVKETLQTQVQTQPSGFTPIAKEKRTTVSALTTTAPADAVNQTPEAISVMPVEQSTLATTTQEKMQALTPVPTSSGSTSPSSEPAPQNFRSTKTPLLIESTTRQVAPVVIPEPTETGESRKELILAATMATKKFNDLFDLFDNTPELEDVKITSMSNPSSEDSTSQQALSETTESMEIETITSSTKESTIPSDPSALVDPDRQGHQRKMGSVADQLREKFNQRQAKANQTKQQSEEAKPTPSASADSARQQQRMTLSEELNSRFRQRQANSGQNTRNSEETKSDSSASADSARQQQRRSLFNDLKGFQFNKGPQRKGRTKQKSEEAKPGSSASADPALQQKTNNMIDELNRRLKQRQVQNKQASEDVKLDPSTSQNELNRFGLRKTSRFDELVHGKAPAREQESRPAPILMPQKPVAMKRGELGKKSSLATLVTPAAQLDELIVRQEKLEKSIEWQRKNIRQFKPAESLKELEEIKRKIGVLRRQVDREKKAVKAITQDLASSSIPTDVKEESVVSTAQSEIQIGGKKKASNLIGQGRPSLSSLLSTTQDNLLEGIKGGVQLNPVSKEKKAKKKKEPTNDLERALFSRRQVVEDDDSDDDNGIDLSYLSKSVDIPPVSTPVKTSTKPISADISPTKRARLAMLGKATPQAASALSLSEQLRAAKKQKKAQQKNPLPVIEPVEEERKVNAFTSSLFSSSAWNLFSKKFDNDEDTNTKGESHNNLPLSTASSDSDDDEWEGWE